ncbi:MAG: TolC family protein [Thermaceae bacterium]|nr:TolC family protein [Thermaceae bacterium]
MYRLSIGLLMGLLGWAWAQNPAPNPWAQFLAPLKNYPGLQQALHGTRAAADQVDVLSSPVGFQATGGYSLLNVSPPDAGGPCRPVDPSYQPNPACFPLPTSGTQASLGLNFTPFLAGDIGSKVAQANATLAQTQLSLRQTLASLEAQAVLAANRVKLAQNALELAKQGESVSKLSVEATQTRFDKGGATQLELDQAQQSLAQAQANRLQAEENLTVARHALQDLVGITDPPDLPLPALPADTKPVGVGQAELALQKAQAASDNAQWNSYPVLQLGYTHQVSSNASLNLGIQSRTFQPSLSLTYQNPSQTVEPYNRINDQFQIGLSVNFSAATFPALDAAQQGVAQAQAALDAAQRQAALQLESLKLAYAQAQRQVELSQNAYALAQRSLQDAQSREQSGLGTPLATAQAALGLYQAGLTQNQAQLNLLTSILNVYIFYAQPLAEVAL